MVRRALLYCTFNGVANCTNGIGRQAQTLLSALDHRWEDLRRATGPFTPFLAIPTPTIRTWAYDPAMLTAAQRIIQRRGGRIIYLDHELDTEFWSVPTWRTLSARAAEAALRLTADFDHVGVIAVDTPFVGTANACLSHRDHPGLGRLSALLALYGTAHLHKHPALDSRRLAWEHAGLTAVRRPRMHVADIGRFLTQHLTDVYRIHPAHFLPWRSSLDLAASDLQPMAVPEALAVAARYGVPLDRPIVLTIGRTDPVKGIDLLIDALAPLRERVHLVALVIPFDRTDPLLEDYRRQITARRLRTTLISSFTRELPRALASLPHTRAVACPSRAETLANVPFEVALWARHGGPLVCAPAIDGFSEQISHQITGLTYDPGRDGALTRIITCALQLTEPTRRRICRAAYRRVAAERDVVTNLAETLDRLLPPITAAPR